MVLSMAARSASEGPMWRRGKVSNGERLVAGVAVAGSALGEITADILGPFAKREFERRKAGDCNRLGFYILGF